VHLFLSGDADELASPSVAALKARLGLEAAARGRSAGEYLAALLHECVAEEKFFECAQVLLQLFPLAREMPLSSAPADGLEHTRHLEHALARTELVWSIVLLREYYERFRPVALQHQHEQQLHAHEQVSAVTRAGATSSGRHYSWRRPSPRILNASTPFHLLPLAEGSASVELADPTDGVATATGDSSSPSSAKPLLQQAFLDTVLHRVERHFEQHQPLQRAFDAYVRSIVDEYAAEDAAASNGKLPTALLTRSSAANVARHPLLGSLLVFWQIPSPHSLCTGVRTLRQHATQAQGRTPTSFPASWTTSTQRLLLAGLLWPQLSPSAVRAILRAAGLVPLN